MYREVLNLCAIDVAFRKGSCSVQSMCMHAKGVFFVCLVFLTADSVKSTRCKKIYRIFFRSSHHFKLSFLLSAK